MIKEENSMKNKVKIPVKIQRNAENIYLQYGGASADIEVIKISDLSPSLRAFLLTLTSDEYEADIRAKEYTEQ